jgi:SAM-dependent methyltransferase
VLTGYQKFSDEALAELDTWLEPDERSKWQSFYDYRARSCPFFQLVPDENLSEWLQHGRIAPGSALDLGCGNGRNSIFLARRGFSVQAVDYSVSAVAWAKEEIANAQVSVRVHCSSVFEFQVNPSSYDLVYDSGCFHHIPPHRRHQYVRLVAGALKPGGALGLVCFAPEGGSGYSDEDVYKLKSLGGGLGYEQARLREIWGTDFCIESLQRMRDQPSDSGLFGKDYLWALLARRSEA